MLAVCKVCNQEKEMARYQKEAGGKYYFRKFCIQCWSKEREQYAAEYRKVNIDKLKESEKLKYIKNKNNLNANSRRYYARLRDKVFSHYGNKCACCSETQPMFLTLDHKNNDGAEHRKKIGVGHILYRWIIDNDYPSSIQLLCHNCNSGKYRNGGHCPHEYYNSQNDFFVPWNAGQSVGVAGAL